MRVWVITLGHRLSHQNHGVDREHYSPTILVAIMAHQAMWPVCLLPVLLSSLVKAESTNSYKATCPPENVSLNIAGLAAGNRLVQGWQKQYTSKYCSGFNVSFHWDTWDSALARVCDSSLVHSAVDLAGMSGSFFLSQATTVDGWSFYCKQSKQHQVTTAVRLDVYHNLHVTIA